MDKKRQTTLKTKFPVLLLPFLCLLLAFLLIENNREKNLQKIDLERKSIEKDERVDGITQFLYFKAQSELTNMNIPNPIEILDKLDIYKKEFQKYVNIANSKSDIERYNLLNNTYVQYMSNITGVDASISEDLARRYKTNNIKM